MQHPTLTNVRIRSTRDALQIFYAVARNILPMTTRRLDAEERRASVPLPSMYFATHAHVSYRLSSITSGCVYIWEERCANSEATGMGMERWYALHSLPVARTLLIVGVPPGPTAWAGDQAESAT